MKRAKSSTPSRRTFLASSLAAGAAGLLPSRFAGTEAAVVDRAPFYADGLSFLTSDEIVRQSGLKLFLADVSSVEVVTDNKGANHFYRTFDKCKESLVSASKYVREESKTLYLVQDGQSIRPDRGCGVIFQFQSAEPIEDQLDRIAYFRERGIRTLQITHNESNLFGASYLDERKGDGLTNLGHQGVKEMNRLGVIVDLAHSSRFTAADVANTSKRPFIISHSACRAVLDNPRCSTDEMIRAVAESGGVFGIFMVSYWLTENRVARPDHFLAHVRHAVNVAGIEAVAIANDYPTDGLRNGKGRPFNNRTDMEIWYPFYRSQNANGVPGFAHLPRHAVIDDFNTVHRMEAIHRTLLDGGFSADDSARIMGGNWRRFFRENL